MHRTFFLKNAPNQCDTDFSETEKVFAHLARRASLLSLIYECLVPLGQKNVYTVKNLYYSGKAVETMLKKLAVNYDKTVKRVKVSYRKYSFAQLVRIARRIVTQCLNLLTVVSRTDIYCEAKRQVIVAIGMLYRQLNQLCFLARACDSKKSL